MVALPGEVDLSEPAALVTTGAGQQVGARGAAGGEDDNDDDEFVQLSAEERAFVHQREGVAITWYRRFLLLEGKPLSDGYGPVFAGGLFMPAAQLQAKLAQLGETLIVAGGLLLFVALAMLGDVGTVRPHAVLASEDHNATLQDAVAEPSRAPRIEATHTGLLILSATTSLMILFRGMNLLFVFRSAAWQAELSPRQDILQAYQVAQMMAFLPIFFVPTMAIVAALAISMLSVFETAGAAVLLSFLFLNMMAP